LFAAPEVAPKSGRIRDPPSKLESKLKISMYEASVPVFVRMLNNLAAILEKAAAHAEAKKIDPAVFCQGRLFPDMFPLTRQVQIATDAAKGAAARLAQVDVPAYEDNEANFAELVQRCRKTVAFLETLKPGQFEGAEDRTVTWKTRTAEKSMQGMPYLLNHVTPNLYFHVTTAYGILRHNGVELGKQDFLGRS
jgi:uncharacterized protein